MYEGMSYLKLYYNKACTRELPKDEEGNYIYKSSNISTNAIMPFVLTLWCKNEGSHRAYDVSLVNVSSDITVEVQTHKTIVYPKEVVSFKLNLNIPKGDSVKHNIGLRFEYDSI